MPDDVRETQISTHEVTTTPVVERVTQIAVMFVTQRVSTARAWLIG